MSGTPRPATPIERFSASVTDGHLKGALDALVCLPVNVLREVLLNAGFRVAFEQTKPKVLAAIQAQLLQAVAARTLPRNPWKAEPALPNDALFGSAPAVIGENEWRVIVRPSVLDGRCTEYQWRRIGSLPWRQAGEWPTFNHNDGLYMGCPRSLADKVFFPNQPAIEAALGKPPAAATGQQLDLPLSGVPRFSFGSRPSRGRRRGFAYMQRPRAGGRQAGANPAGSQE